MSDADRYKAALERIAAVATRWSVGGESVPDAVYRIAREALATSDVERDRYEHAPQAIRDIIGSPSEAEQAAPQYEWVVITYNEEGREHDRELCVGREDAEDRAAKHMHWWGDMTTTIQRRAVGEWERVEAEQAAAEAAGPEPDFPTPSVAGEYTFPPSTLPAPSVAGEPLRESARVAPHYGNRPNGTPEQKPGVYCACLANGSDPRKVEGLRCVYSLAHAAGLDAAAARSAEHEAAQGLGTVK